MLAVSRGGISLLLPLSGVLMLSGYGGHASEIPWSRGSDQGGVPEPRVGDSLFKKEVDWIMAYFQKHLPTLLMKEDINLVLEWRRIMREGLGEGVFVMEKLDGDRWFFRGFPENQPIPLRGDPPEVLDSLKSITIFGFDAIKFLFTRIDADMDQQYQLTYPRMLVEYSDGTSAQEIVLNPFYVADVRYTGGEWFPEFRKQFYGFLSWLSCDRFGSDEELRELLAQTSWFMAIQIDSGSEKYVNTTEWCTFAKKQLE